MGQRRITSETAQFAVNTIISWWEHLGNVRYPNAQTLTITADAGGSNNPSTRLWRYELQRLADTTRLSIRVCHFPPGTSKWNKIEHRLFCHITQNWRGKPLISLQAIVSLIAATTTATGLRVHSELDTASYEPGIKVSDQDIAQVNLRRDKFLGDWNYEIQPRKPNH